MAFLNYVRDKVLNHLFGNNPAWVGDSTYYIGLASGTIQNDGDNLSSVEFSGGGYSRQPYSNTAANWINIDNGVVRNSSSIVWSEATADWGTVTDFFITNIATVGSSSGLIVAGPLHTPKIVPIYGYPSFSANSITILLD